MRLFGLNIGGGAPVKSGMDDDTPVSAIHDVSVEPRMVTGEASTGQTSVKQEVDSLVADDLLGEADVYWTYGKWHDAMPIYEWWILHNGSDPANEVARKYLDCTAKAMDFDAFHRMMRSLIERRIDRTFLQEMAIFGLMRDPSNFDLIGIAETVEVEESRIIRIAQKVVDAEKTSGQRKADLWRRNRTDAGRIASGKAATITGDDAHHSADVRPLGHLPLLRATSGKDFDDAVSRHDGDIFGILCGESFLDDSAAVVDRWKIESVLRHLRREMESRPLRLTVYVDYLRIAHGEGMREEYAEALLALFSVLLSANAGGGLRRRLLASGRLLGQHWIFDFLSGSEGREFMAVARKVRDMSSVYVPEKAWAKSSAWMQPLVIERQD